MAPTNCDEGLKAILQWQSLEVYKPCTYLATLWDKTVNSTLLKQVDCTNPDCQGYMNTHGTTIPVSSSADCKVLDVATGAKVHVSELGTLCGTVRATVRPIPTSSSSLPTPTPSVALVPGSTTGVTSATDSSSSSTVVIVLAVAGAIVVLLMGLFMWRRHKLATQSKQNERDFVMLEEEPSTVDSANDYARKDKQAKTSTAISSSSSPSRSMALLSQVGVDLGSLALFQVRREDLKIDGTTRQHRGATFDVRRADYLGTAVALKTCRDPKQIRAFVDEMKLLSTLDCPYIVRFVGVWWGKYAADLTLVTELMDGGNLQDALLRSSQQLAQQSRMALDTKLSIARDVVDALVYLHSLQVLHRNLSSHQVLLTSGDAQPLVAKLQGFGQAREVQYDGMTLTAGVGAFRYTAPEVLQDGHYGDSADVFSFGVILSELSTEKAPYDHLRTPSGKPLSSAAIVAGIMAGSAQPAFAPDSPPWYVDLARECLALDPALRPSAAKIAFRLSQLAG